MKRLLALIGLCLSLALLAYDSLPHFTQAPERLARNHRFDQLHWNIFYGQRFVYLDSAFRYQQDFAAIKALIAPGHLLLSDMATSYYAAASLPVYVRNIHRHQGRWKSPLWGKMLDGGSACHLEQPAQFAQFKDFLIAQNKAHQGNEDLQLKYAIVNKDRINRNLPYDCLWTNRVHFMANIGRLAHLRYAGEWLNLYEFNALPPSVTLPND